MSQDKIVFEEDEIIEMIKQLRVWRLKLSKHPESTDHVALLNTEQHFMRRLQEIVTKRYFKEKGLE